MQVGWEYIQTGVVFNGVLTISLQLLDLVDVCRLFHRLYCSS